MTNQVILDAAVEAGLYAWGFSSQNIDERRQLLKRILEAAAPHMNAGAIAEALKEAAELIEPFSGIGLANGATRGDVARWLKARAEDIRTAK